MLSIASLPDDPLVLIFSILEASSVVQLAIIFRDGTRESTLLRSSITHRARRLFGPGILSSATTTVTVLLIEDVNAWINTCGTSAAEIEAYLQVALIDEQFDFWCPSYPVANGGRGAAQHSGRQSLDRCVSDMRVVQLGLCPPEVAILALLVVTLRRHCGAPLLLAVGSAVHALPRVPSWHLSAPRV